MLPITIPGTGELWDERKQEFLPPLKPITIRLEHSLVSLSKWESKWNKPFIDSKNISYEETIDYIRCMTLTQNIDPEAYYRLTNKNIQEVNAYINAPMTATTFSQEKDNTNKRERITSELIYYWMVALNIPFECEKWHLNRLLTLIRICNVKNAPPKKKSMRDIMRRNSALNDARRNRLKSKG